MLPLLNEFEEVFGEPPELPQKGNRTTISPFALHNTCQYTWCGYLIRARESDLVTGR